jgi:FtsP/CotA-like multicopper oxidase with cupredoxin domain
MKVKLLCLLLMGFCLPVLAQTVRYDLYLADTMVNFSGKSKMAMAVNGQIPGPALSFTEGDTAEVHVHNMMDMETSIHWHGFSCPIKWMVFPI